MHHTIKDQLKIDAFLKFFLGHDCQTLFIYWRWKIGRHGKNINLIYNNITVTILSQLLHWFVTSDFFFYFLVF